MSSPHRILQDLFRAPYQMVAPTSGTSIGVNRQLSIIPIETGAGAFTLTLQQPTKAGLISTLVLDIDGGGDATVTLTGGYDQTGSTQIVFGDAGDFVTLVSVKKGAATYVWRLLAFDGVTGPTIEFAGLDVDTLQVDTSANIAEQISTVLAAEHGDGAISTAFAPITTRRIVNGTIITEIKVDLTGLGCKGAAAGDAIGLVSTVPDAYIGRYVVATDGIVFKVEMICLELPAGSGSATLNIDLTPNSSSGLGYDEAVSGTAIIDNSSLSSGSTLVAGEVVQNAVPALTGNDYLYLTEGDTAATDGVYTAGQFIIRLYGHPVLT